VEQELRRQGTSREELGREAFVERVWEWLREYGGVIMSQFRRMGCSLDYERERFTMDDGYVRAVMRFFVHLYDRGWMYRANRIINWCTECHTSISDLEVEHIDVDDALTYARYPLADGEGSVTIATVRPATMLADVAVAVHPDDERYAQLIGKEVIVPVVGRHVPVIADERVETGFGTGALKVTPGHDPMDFDIGRDHGLPEITVIDFQGRMTGPIPPEYMGLTEDEAADRVVAWLREHDQLEKRESYRHSVGFCDRSGTRIQPLLSLQWWCDMETMAKPAIEAIDSGRVTFHPPVHGRVASDWLKVIRPWNVSRQLWWGHRIPAWYCPDGHVTVSADIDGPAACAGCGRLAPELRQDPDIFDTWFSSGLWPFSTLGWPDDTDDLRRFYPTAVMETGYDIIFFWVARMMMLGIELTGTEPFHTIALSGLIRDPLGQKMSKTKGNVVDPLAVMEEAGADALRFALIHGASAGQDQRFGPQKLDNARNFANKLWNAARFVLGARPAEIAASTARIAADAAHPPTLHLGPIERWIRSRAAATTAAVDRGLAEYQFGEVTRALYDGIWSEFCDWGIELAKVRLADETIPAVERAATWWTLVDALDTYLRLLHPVMPFVTEAIWGALPHRPGEPALLIVAAWPTAAGRDPVADARIGQVVDTIVAIRNARAHADLPAGAWLEAHVALPADAEATFEALAPAIGRLARARPLVLHATADDLPRPAGVLEIVLPAGDIEVTVLPPSAAEDTTDRDRVRLEKELAEAEGHLAAARARLANPSFAEKAPAAVVHGARTREAELGEQVARLQVRLGR
jgi:valyl-tRNA synthetase